jgi:hypothetical protein
MRIAPFRLFAILLCVAQAPAQQSSTKTAICDESANCAHQFIDGHKFKMLTSDGITVSVSMIAVGKYVRADVFVLNSTAENVDVLPATFSLEEVEPKQKKLAYVDAEKIIRSARSSAAWSNTLTAMGAGMQRQQSTTNTTSTGTASTTGSDGAYATGTYRGSSTSTTSSPDYAAQNRADQAIRDNNATIASLSARLSNAALKSNTILPNQSIRGFVFFEREKKAASLMISATIGGTVYKFPFSIPRQ